SNNVSHYLEYQFSGTNTHIHLRKGPSKGIVNIKITDLSDSTVVRDLNLDTYSSTWGVVAKAFTGLKKSNYKVRLSVTGTKNELSTGTATDFDKALTYPSIEYTFIGREIFYNAMKFNSNGIVDVIVDGNESKRK